MEISYIFEILADYIDFIITYLTFGSISEYLSSDKINPDTVVFAITGTSLAYLIGKVGKNNKPGDESPITNIIFIDSGLPTKNRTRKEVKLPCFSVSFDTFLKIVICPSKGRNSILSPAPV